MEIAGLTVAQHAEYLALVDAEIRPPQAVTRAWEDFPLALGSDNLPWQLGATDENGRLAGGLAVLVRPFATSCGQIAVGAVGSVVTRADCRGRGLSARLQAAALALLRRQGVPLAALWTDRPEIYAGRGFVPAGWEWHADLKEASLPGAVPDGVTLRPWRPDDAQATARLYAAHRWRTVRLPGDAARLYGMPGTRGLVAETPGRVLATVFCGKGADFTDYVAEWSGEPALVLCLLGRARALGLAGAALVPAGAEAMAEHLAAAGAPLTAMPSACWAVLSGAALTAALTATLTATLTEAGAGPAPAAPDPRAWLGFVAADGTVNPGPLTVAVWGFDSA